MAAPTGLYGHVQVNHSRSLMLFAMFLVAFQLLGVVTLWIPLLMFDAAHNPLDHPLAYARRYVPLLFLLSFILYAAQMWWFVGSVRRRTRFRYVDSAEEPRLCRILEPLAIAAGIETPYAAVIETPALNAFAAGTRKHHMVVVATRGLIDGLDDDELAGVLANAVIHIRNRDTRLLAAATIFMRNMKVLHRKPKNVPLLMSPLQVAALVFLPVFLPVILVLGFFIAIAYRLAYGSRALIGMSRELIADAEAVRLTHNPAAFASALRTVDRYRHDGELGDEHDAMLFVGVTDGHLATHPTLDERIGALARTTGSMVLEDTRRLDTRPPQQRPAAGFGRRPDPRLERIATLAEEPERRGLWGTFWSVRDPEYNWVGLNRRETWMVVASVAAIGLVYQNILVQPGGVARVFNVSGVQNIAGMGNVMVQCTVGRFWDGSDEKGEWCEKQAAESGRMFDHIPTPDGRPREFLTPKEQNEKDAQAQIARGCFGGRWDGYSNGSSYAQTLDDYLRWAREHPVRLQGFAPGPELDEKLLNFGESRLLQIDNALHFFGESGWATFAAATNTPENDAALDLLAARLKDPQFTKPIYPRTRADLELLVTKRSALKPCWAERVAASAASPPRQ
jgi:Zn-dependent protease with chaperone function